MRAEQEASRRSNGSVVISTILSLLVVVVAVAVVAWLVLRSPSTAVDSAERLDPIGTALPAPSEPPTLPALVPTDEPEPEAEPEPTALGFTGEAPAVTGLPTVAAPQEPEEAAGPTPTPRVIARPTDVPPTPLPAAPTLPPSVPVEEVPVVALQPVEVAPAAPTSAPAQAPVVSRPTPVPAEADDDPFNIFDEVDVPRIVPGDDDPLARVRELQEERESEDDGIIPEIDVGEAIPAVESGDDQPDSAVPDVDAMIDEITAQVTDANRNPNVSDAGRRITARDDDDDDDRDNSTASKRRKSARDRLRERTGRAPTSDEDDRDSNGRAIVPGNPRPGNGNDDDCSIGDPGFPFC